MHIPLFQKHSLKTRIILVNLLTMLALFLVVGSYIKSLMREELLLFTGEQQRSALSLLATQVDHGLRDRLSSLSLAAGAITSPMMDDASRLQAYLADQRALGILFNAGLRAWSPSLGWVNPGLATQGEPAAPGISAQALASLMQDPRSVVGPIVYKGLSPAQLSFAVPIRDAAGAVAGVLAGTMHLDEGHFLTELTAQTYGQNGHYFLIDARQRMIFSTSNPARRMELLPAPGVHPQIDSFMQGFEGTTLAVNPHGLEVLVSIRQIPLAGWYASVILPREEAIGLIRAIAPRSRWVGGSLALLGLGLVWLILRRQLAPMTAAVRTLDGFVRKNEAPQALQVVRADEVGQLVGGFNRLLDTLNQQQQVLQQSELFKQAVLNSVTTEIAVLNHSGLILSANEAWQRGMAGRASGTGPVAGPGANYLSLCEEAAVCKGIKAVLGGEVPHFHLDCACHTPEQQRWCSVSVTSLDGAGQPMAVVSVEDITERIQMQEQVRALAFYDPLTQLPNRRLVEDRLTHELLRARRMKHRLALLFIDLDQFKPINDSMGHAVGDSLLHMVAQRIQDCLRESDTAARLGGDEFVVLLPELQSQEDARTVAEKIRHELEREFVTAQGLSLKISSSIGVALYPDHGQTEKDLMRQGDEAMYQAKKAGRNAVMIYVPQSTGA